MTWQKLKLNQDIIVTKSELKEVLCRTVTINMLV